MEIIETEVDSANSQDFPFAQSQTEDTIKICQVCRFTSREKTCTERSHADTFSV